MYNAEPYLGWVKTRLCSSHMYCTYDKPQIFCGQDDAGRFFTFSAAETRHYHLLGSIWLAAKRVKKLPDGFNIEAGI